MSKHKLWIQVVPQILKELVNNLYNCKARFEVNTSKATIVIWDVTNFNLDETASSDAKYGIIINTENNTKSIFIAKDNVKEFTVHFGA